MSYIVYCPSEQATGAGIIASTVQGRLTLMKFGAAMLPGFISDTLKDDKRFAQSFDRATDVLDTTTQSQMIPSILEELESKGMTGLPETIAALHYSLSERSSVRLLVLVCNAAMEPCLPDMLSGQACIHVQTTHLVSSISQLTSQPNLTAIEGGRKPHSRYQLCW
jgi:hypothetical protein